jgi:predicted PurR-regulated permease PerM
VVSPVPERSGRDRASRDIRDEETSDVTPPASSSAGLRATFRPAQAPSWPFIIALLLGILAVIVFMLAASALFVFGVGVALAFFLVPVVNWLVRRGWPRWLAAMATVAVALLGVLLVGTLILVILVEQGVTFVQNLPTYLQELGTWYQGLDLPDQLRSAIDALTTSIQGNLAAVDPGVAVSGLIGSVLGLLGGLFAWFLLPFFLFYLLKDQPRMAGSFYSRVPQPWRDDVDRMLTISVGNIARYFKSEFLVGAIMFVLITLGMIAIGALTGSPLLIEFSFLLGLTAFVMELVPQIGPIISYIPALILALASGPAAIVAVSIYYFVAFNVEGSILVPTFQGRMINFTGASVLALIAMGFALAGIIGAILALPVASIVRDLFRLFFDQAVARDLVMLPDGSDAASPLDARGHSGTLPDVPPPTEVVKEAPAPG